MNTVTKLIVAAFCFALILTAQAQKPKAAAPHQSAGYGVTLALDKMAYVSGKTPAAIHATMTLFNYSGTPLEFNEHGRQVEWQILDSHRNVAWDYSVGRMFPHFVIHRTLAQGQTDYPYDIPLTAQDGTPLPAGNYTLRGQLTGVSCVSEVGFTVTN